MTRINHIRQRALTRCATLTDVITARPRRLLRPLLPVVRSPWARLAVTCLAGFIFVRSVDLGTALTRFGHLAGGWALLALLLTGLSVVASVIEWGALLRGTGHGLGWRFLGGWYCRGLFVNQVLPAGVGGDAVRAVRVGRVTGHGPVLASLVGSRMAGTLGMAIWGLGGAVLLHTLVRVPGLVGFAIFAGAMCVAWAFALRAESIRELMRRRGQRLRLNRVTHWIQPLTAALDRYRSVPWAVAQCILAGTLGWGLNLFAMQAFATALGATVPWTVFALVLPIALLATFIPISANGIGVREGLLVFLLVQFHVALPTAAALALFVDFQLFPFAVVGGLLHLVEGRAAGRQRGRRLPTGLTGVGRGPLSALVPVRIAEETVPRRGPERR